jgi:transposase
MDINLLSQLFPSELIAYFTITSFETHLDSRTNQEYIVIDFEEKNVLPGGHSPLEYESKGFMESKRIQDFPLRGKPVFLRVKKRRWRHKGTGEVIKRDFTFMADGSKFTQELSDFLKDAGGYANRYHEQHSQLLRGE